MEELSITYMMVLGSSPMLVASIVGIVMAMLLWQHAPKAALFLLIGCVLNMLLTLSNAWVYGWYVPGVTHNEGVSGIRHVLTAWSIASNLGHAVGFGLLIWAVFAERANVGTSAR